MIDRNVLLKAIYKHSYLATYQIKNLLEADNKEAQAISTAISRMLDDKLINFVQNESNKKKFYYVTTRGARELGIDIKRIKTPNAQQVKSNHEDIIIKTLVTLKKLGQIPSDLNGFLNSYKTGREITKIYGTRMLIKRVCDLWVNQKSGKIAYEIELSPKWKARYIEIFEKLEKQYRASLAIALEMDSLKADEWQSLVWVTNENTLNTLRNNLSVNHKFVSFEQHLLRHDSDKFSENLNSLFI